VVPVYVGWHPACWGLIAAAGQQLSRAAPFIFHVGADLLIDIIITAYWNDASSAEQLATSID